MAKHVLGLSEAQSKVSNPKLFDSRAIHLQYQYLK